MCRLLISWMAFNNDFTREDKSPKVDGPVGSFHKHFFKKHGYEKHILLSQKKTEYLSDRLLNLLNREFSYQNNEIEVRLVEIQDVINVHEIQPKVESILREYGEYQIDIFCSPGTPMMQLAWYISHVSLDLNTRLIQTREAKFTKDGKAPEFITIEVEKTQVPNTLIARQHFDEEEYFFEDYKITNSIQPVYEDAERIAKAESEKPITTLITGETGTGKEHLAHFIHQSSPVRSKKIFKAVNCAAFTDELLLSELFGHVKGAFTGSSQDREGVFKSADGGSVFLDEIGDISPFMQQSLLRVLQEKEIRPVGSDKPVKVNVRVICATHKDLIEQCKKGTFRWDLYYRITNSELRLPSLQERGQEEKVILIDYFLRQLKDEFRKKTLLKLSPEIKRLLLKYSFPGNIRELISVLSSLYVYYKDDGKPFEDVQRLPSRIIHKDDPKSLLLEDANKEHIKKVFQMFKGNIKKTHEALGISRNNLTDKIDKYNISLEEEY